MANKTQRVNETYQLRRGANGTLLVSQDGVKWQTPAEAGIATKLYVDEAATSTLASANEYTDTGVAGAKSYTNTEVDLAKAEMQNYTDDVVSEYDDDVTLRLSAKADLVGGTVPASQLPGFADTLQLYDSYGDFPSAGLTNVIYIDESTNKAYRWNGAAYTQIGESLVLGETEDTAYRGDRGKVAYDHTTATNNPHSVNKTQVGLDQVDNTSDLNKPVSTATSAALSGKANTVHTHVPADVTGLSDLLDDKEDAFSKGSLVAGTNVTLSGDLGNRLVGSGNVTISAADAPAAPVTSVAGKTGAVTLAKGDVGLNNVDNTSDLDKPVSTATSTALAGKADTSHTHNASDITTGVFDTARLGAGTANVSKVLFGDGTWKDAPSGGGGSAYTFENGLTENGGTAELGGEWLREIKVWQDGPAIPGTTPSPWNITNLSMDLGDNRFGMTKHSERGEGYVASSFIGVDRADYGPVGSTDGVLLEHIVHPDSTVERASRLILGASGLNANFLLGSQDDPFGTAVPSSFLYTDNNGNFRVSQMSRLTGSINKPVSTNGSGSTTVSLTDPNTPSKIYKILNKSTASFTISAPSGTGATDDGRVIKLRIRDNNTTPKTIVWDAAYKPLDVPLPTATVPGKLLFVTFEYLAADSSWYATSIQQEA